MLLSAMLYSFPRSAILAMWKQDYFRQGSRGGLRLDEKGGKQYDCPGPPAAGGEITAGRGEPRPRAAGVVGQLPRVRGRTPGLLPLGRPRATSAVRLSCSNGAPGCPRGRRPRWPDGPTTKCPATTGIMPSVLRDCVRAPPHAPRAGRGVRPPAADADAVRGPRSASGSPGPARPAAGTLYLEPNREHDQRFPAASPGLGHDRGGRPGGDRQVRDLGAPVDHTPRVVAPPRRRERLGRGKARALHPAVYRDQGRRGRGCELGRR